MLLRFAYILFLAILIALFVGAGIATFYKVPQFPESRFTSRLTQPQTASEEAQLIAEQKEDQRRYQTYEKDRKEYNRNVSVIALIFSFIFLIVGLLLFKQFETISDGIVLGSIFTLIYSIFSGFDSREEMYRFISVSVGLLVVLFLGYEKFIKPTAKKNKR